MAEPPPAQAPKERKLPPLRKNLQFLRGAPTNEGVPTWTVVDPVRNRVLSNRVERLSTPAALAMRDDRKIGRRDRCTTPPPALGWKMWKTSSNFSMRTT